VKSDRVAEGLYRSSRNGKTLDPYYAYFWRDGKQIKQELDAVDVEQAHRELGALRGEKSRLAPRILFSHTWKAADVSFRSLSD